MHYFNSIIQGEPMKQLILIIAILFATSQAFANNTYNFYFEDGKKSETDKKKKKKVKVQVKDGDEDEYSGYYDDDEDSDESAEEDDDDSNYTGPVSFSGSLPPQANLNRPGMIEGLYRNTSRNYISFGVAVENQMNNDEPVYVLRAKVLPTFTLEGTLPTSDDERDKLYRVGGILESDHTRNFAFQVNFGAMHSGSETKDWAPYIGLGYRLRLFNHVDISLAGGKLLNKLKHSYTSEQYDWDWTDGSSYYEQTHEKEIDHFLSVGLSLAFQFGKGA
jgi:hypothetical protein